MGVRAMTEDKPISFGDNVRVKETPVTEQAGVAGLAGNVHGETRPSVTNVDVIGEAKEDFALNVFFENRNESLWFAPELLDLVDHAPGTEITIKGIDKKWVRREDGKWDEQTTGRQRKGLLSGIRKLFGRK